MAAKCRIMVLAALMALLTVGRAESGAASTAPARLALEEFVRLAAANDTEFERILIRGAALRYSMALSLPAGDIVLSAKSGLAVFLGRDEKDLSRGVSLGRLFPLSGTEVSAGYEMTPAAGSPMSSSELEFTVAQSIAANAFGRSTRLLKRITGLETDVARHQIIEAYEDYVAAVISIYLQWHEAHENLKIARSSYQENLKLLDNIRLRKKSKVAKTIDVNKITIQVLAKKEKLVGLEEKYTTSLNLVRRVIRSGEKDELAPLTPEISAGTQGAFDRDYERFERSARTYRILALLEEKSSLKVKREADDLLPSIELALSYGREGDGAGIQDAEDRMKAGISLEWPFGDSKGRAGLEVAKIELEKARLDTQNTRSRLKTRMRNLYERMEQEKRLIAIAKEKIDLARSILRDESENYTYAKASLNDYISAVNLLDNNRFGLILHSAKLKKLSVEWLRLTDRLVVEDDIKKRHGDVLPTSEVSD